MRPMTAELPLAESTQSPHSETPSAVLDDDYDYEDRDAISEEKDEHPVLRSKVISEAKTRLQKKKLRQLLTGTRNIAFKGDESGSNMPTNLSYSPRKVTWKGKAAMVSKQLLAEKEKNLVN
ncbi:hypothetical protein A4A49_05824 [Nicotiana attenuata]|uniref:Uncharacterized protein n=1 Tax=Nicotiana attenuata TaxID=49451 RepID=A0A1J6ISB5_NICAT|nr:hypothetical protein A4A49_05824 [Nicotiana attenuata]